MTLFSTGPTAGSRLFERFALLTAESPSAPALVSAATGEITTRAALLDEATRLAGELAAHRLGRGHALAVQLPNSPRFIALFLATLRAGVTFVPLDRDAQRRELAAIVDGLGLNAVAASSGSAALSITYRNDATSVALAGCALLKLTSGSTGRPKGIRTTEDNLIADCRNICSTMGITPDDRNLGAIPFSHSYGFSNLVTPLLWQGTSVVYSNDYLPAAIVELSNQHAVTVLPGIPLMFEHLSGLPVDDGSFEQTRLFISAGAPLQAATSRRFRERFGHSIHTFYGCSECGGITYDRAGGAVERNSAGSALDGVELRIDPEDSRLLVRSDAVAAGYLESETDAAAKFTEGEYATDDIAEIAAGGEVTLIGRLGDLINTAGKKVNPREIEAAILEMPGVRDARVYGEQAGARGEVVAAAVVAERDVTPAMVREFCSARLSPHKVPRIVKLIDAIPLDERGKVKRALLAAL